MAFRVSFAKHGCARAQRPHGIWQLAQRACPATFASNPAAGQLQLHPVADNGTAVLSFDVPGTVRSELHICDVNVAMPGVWSRASSRPTAPTRLGCVHLRAYRC